MDTEKRIFFFLHKVATDSPSRAPFPTCEHEPWGGWVGMGGQLHQIHSVLVAKIIRFYSPKTSCAMSTRCDKSCNIRLEENNESLVAIESP